MPEQHKQPQPYKKEGKKPVLKFFLCAVPQEFKEAESQQFYRIKNNLAFESTNAVKTTILSGTTSLTLFYRCKFYFFKTVAGNVIIWSMLRI